MTTQILLSRNSRAKFRPLGYRGVLHRHARSGSKVWRIKHQVVKWWLSPLSPTERRGHCIACLTSLRVGQRSDESSITNKRQSFSVSPTGLPGHHAPCASHSEWVKGLMSDESSITNKQRSLCVSPTGLPDHHTLYISRSEWVKGLTNYHAKGSWRL